MRGNPQFGKLIIAHHGTIPAYAGKPYISQRFPAVYWDYPRVCGETSPCRRLPAPAWGLSPRMRGNQVHKALVCIPHGTIPAYAGKPTPPTPEANKTWDYPRVCGETRSTDTFCNRFAGLSPRMRGNRSALQALRWGQRTIPAYAGKPQSRFKLRKLNRDYPRVCGETWGFLQGLVVFLGLSPRMRGNRYSGSTLVAEQGTIPAYAGKPSWQLRKRKRKRDYPRVCGETFTHSVLAAIVEGLSPRMRGNL